ncbi:MAG: cobalt-precorrin-6A reductase [Kiloniellaceae bacterium]
MAEPLRVLILGGTGEAVALANRLASTPGLAVTTSLAGRTRAPAAVPGAVRRGGFGGPEGLADYLRARGIGAVVDATHPYAARMSANAAAACGDAGVPRLMLRRPPWRPGPGDRWIDAVDGAAAAAALPAHGARVFLAIGRDGLAPFAARADTWFLVRLIDPPAAALSLARCAVICGRGPFAVDDEIALLRAHRIDAVVSKNSGGTATHGKIEAARRLGLPVVMIARPPPTPGDSVATVDAAVAWVVDRVV